MWLFLWVEVLASLVYWVMVYFFVEEARSRIIPEKRRRRLADQYFRDGRVALTHKRELRKTYVDLLKRYMPNRTSVTSTDIGFFYRLLSTNLDTMCWERLHSNHRICFRCKEGFCVGDRVIGLQTCGHVSHWECFRSVLSARDWCIECKKAIVSLIRLQLQSEERTKRLSEILKIPSVVKPPT